MEVSFNLHTYGTMFTIGNLVPYLASYLGYIESKKNNFNLSIQELENIYSEQTVKVNWIYFICLLFDAIGMYACSYLTIKFGTIKTLVIGSFLTSFGFGLTFFSLKYGPISIYIVF